MADPEGGGIGSSRISPAPTVQKPVATVQNPLRRTSPPANLPAGTQEERARRLSLGQHARPATPPPARQPARSATPPARQPAAAATPTSLTGQTARRAVTRSAQAAQAAQGQTQTRSARSRPQSRFINPSAAPAQAAVPPAQAAAPPAQAAAAPAQISNPFRSTARAALMAARARGQTPGTAAPPPAPPAGNPAPNPFRSTAMAALLAARAAKAPARGPPPGPPADPPNPPADPNPPPGPPADPADPVPRTLSRQNYKVSPITGDGWCFYAAVLKGHNPALNPTAQDAQAFALQIADILRQRLQNEDGYRASLQEVISGEADGRTIEDNLPQRDNPLLKPNGSDFIPITPEEYLTKLHTLRNPNDITIGPQEWGNPSIIGAAAANLLNIQLGVYTGMNEIDYFRSEFNVFPTMNRNTTLPVVNIFFNQETKNHYDTLIEKTDAEKLVADTKKVKNTLKGALSKTLTTARNLLKSKSYPGEIIISGERIRIDETGFDERNVAGTVSFSRAYFPKAEGIELENAKAAFSMIFNNKKQSDIDQLLPPCNHSERAILLEGFGNRLQSLFDEIKSVRANNGDIVILRTKLEQYQKFEILVDELKRRIVEGECEEYNADGSTAGTSELNSESEENFRALLRQFAFMTLQANGQVKGYNNYNDDAKLVQALLEKNQLDEAEMDTYLKLWREQALQTGQNVPSIIGEVLDGTTTQPGMLSTLLEDQLTALYKNIVRDVGAEYKTLPGGDTEFNLYVTDTNKRVGDTKGKIERLLTWIARKNKTAWEELGSLQKPPQAGGDPSQNELIVLQNNTAELQKKLVTAEAAAAAALAAQQAAEQVLSVTKQQMQALQSQNYSLVAAVQSLQMEAATAKAEKAKAEAEVAGVNAQIATLQATPEKHDAAVQAAEFEKLKVKLAVAEASVADANAKMIQKNTEQLQAQQALEQVQSQLGNTTAQMGQLEVEAAKRITTAEASSTAAAQELQKAQQNSALNRESLEQAASDVKALQTAVEVGAAQIQGLNDSVAQAEFNVKEANAAAAAVTAEAQKRVDAAAAERDAAVAAHKELETAAVGAAAATAEELRLSQAKQGAAEAAAAQVGADLSFLELENNKLSTEISNTEANKHATIAVLTDEVHKLDEEVNDLIEAKDAAEQAAAKATTGYQELTEELQKERAAKADSDAKTSEVLGELQIMAQNIINGKPVTVPQGMKPEVGKVFESVLKNMQALKKGPQRGGGSNYICFLSYFITFFMKVFFYSTQAEQRHVLLQKLDALVTQLITDTKGDRSEKDTLHSILDVIFGLVHATETLEDHPFIGLSVVKINNNPDAGKILSTIYATFKLDLELSTDIKSMKSSLAITFPPIYFNRPLDGMTDPTFTYLPDIKNNLNDPKLQQRYQYIDVLNNFAKTTIDIENTPVMIATVLNDKTLNYVSMLTLFVVLGRRYLIAAKDDLALYKCALPKLLTSI